MPPEEVVITGVGVVSPIGIGKDCYWQQMSAGRSGVGPPSSIDLGSIPVVAAGEVRDFDAKKFVTPRKNLKVMVRDSELGVAASVLACQDAGLNPGDIDPERFGVVLGADRISGPLSDSEEPHRRCIVDGRFDFSRWATEGMSVAFPLAFLKVLPNMIASHVSIAHDARGPNNTIHQGDVSGALGHCRGDTTDPARHGRSGTCWRRQFDVETLRLGMPLRGWPSFDAAGRPGIDMPAIRCRP